MESLEGELQVNHLEIVEQFANVVGGLRDELGTKVQSLESGLGAKVIHSIIRWHSHMPIIYKCFYGNHGKAQRSHGGVISGQQRSTWHHHVIA